MKIRLILLFFLMVSFSSVNAQMSNKELKKDLKSKVDNDCRKTAKKLEKEGWKVMPGKLPLARQIQDSRYNEIDQSPEGERSYFIGTHQSIGGNYSAAKQIADTRARGELAQQINVTVSQKITDQVSNLNLGENDIEIIDETVSAGKSVILAQLSGITPTLEMYREVNGSQYEVKVVMTIAYSKALKDAKRAVVSELKKKSDKLAKDLDTILPY